MSKREATLSDVMQRLIRVETRVTTLGNHMGCEMGNSLDRIYLDEQNRITLRGLDSPLSAILQFCRLAGLSGEQQVWYAGKIICLIWA